MEIVTTTNKLATQELRIGNWILVPATDNGVDYSLKSFKILGMGPKGILIGSYMQVKRVGPKSEAFHHPDGYVEAEEIELWADSDKCEPIPLTPEILEKAGFERTPYKDIPPIYKASKLDGFPRMTHTYYRYERDGFIVSEDLWCKGVQLQYLHHLQNLYFDLTGKELTVNL